MTYTSKTVERQLRLWAELSLLIALTIEWRRSSKQRLWRDLVWLIASSSNASCPSLPWRSFTCRRGQQLERHRYRHTRHSRSLIIDKASRWCTSKTFHLLEKHSQLSQSARSCKSSSAVLMLWWSSLMLGIAALCSGAPSVNQSQRDSSIFECSLANLTFVQMLLMYF